jgi:GMP synthase-like glutamine amidotransferase
MWGWLLRFLVFQHLDVEHPGVFRDLWRDAGVDWDTVHLDEGETIPPDLAAYDALVVMGGPMDVWQQEQHPWLAAEIAAIRHFATTLKRPYLGVCLGHQLLAVALGGQVGLARASEVGPGAVRLTDAARTDALFEGLDSPLTAFQWHSAEVIQAPAGAVILAESDLCAIQAFRWGGHAYGMQFHAEITGSTVSEWGGVPAYAKSLDESLGPGAASRLAVQTLGLLPGYRQTAARLSDRFITLVRSARSATLQSLDLRSAL